MNPLAKRLQELRADLDAAWARLDVDVKVAKLEADEAEMAQPEVWNNPTTAQKLARDVAAMKKVVQPWQVLRAQLDDMDELLALGDDDLADEVTVQVRAAETELSELKKQLLFNGKYDGKNAILRISAGAGGDDAQDFAEMLERMYLRWAERSGFEAHVIERSPGETAGVKTSVIEVAGPFAYGKLQSENGVHRMVRLSPFNAESRETSFALVEVLPDIDTPDEVAIDDKDLKIDVYRSGGHGGQSVNTTDSAVRITHIPTGIVVAIQNERSQLQNREKAMEILRSKLAQLQMEQHVDSIADLRAGKSAEWGSQIRNYVLHPYKLAKDTRTKYEEKNVDAVLDGKIDGFINAYLEQSTNSSRPTI
ncbi:peptide chain release factor 2 [Alphaproteobacteria bacterium]|nr:peptide chain release factor 2 [Alphaproteobacteria bacterium]